MKFWPDGGAKGKVRVSSKLLQSILTGIWMLVPKSWWLIRYLLSHFTQNNKYSVACIFLLQICSVNRLSGIVYIFGFMIAPPTFAWIKRHTVRVQCAECIKESDILDTQNIHLCTEHHMTASDPGSLFACRRPDRHVLSSGIWHQCSGLVRKNWRIKADFMPCG